MYNVSHYEFGRFFDATYGSLTALETEQSFPFGVKRVYYIYEVPDGTRRGFHSHRDLHQMLICVSGSVKVLTKTPYEEEITELSSPDQGLYIGPMVWREMYDFTPGAVLLVLASEHYNVDDYIRDYKEYEKIAVDFLKSEAK